MNVTEVRDSDFKNAFPGIFNFTVGILVHVTCMSTQNSLINEWSNFYEKACGIDETTRENTVPNHVKYSLLCEIFELLVLNLPTKTTEQYFDILANFFTTNLEKWDDLEKGMTSK